MSPTTRWSPALAALATLVLAGVAGVGCVHVPDSIKAEFRAAEPDERSNYQNGLRGNAPPVDASDPWSRWGAAAFGAADAGADAQADTEPLPSTEPAAPAAADAGAAGHGDGGIS